MFKSVQEQMNSGRENEFETTFKKTICFKIILLQEVFQPLYRQFLQTVLIDYIYLLLGILYLSLGFSLTRCCSYELWLHFFPPYNLLIDNPVTYYILLPKSDISLKIIPITNTINQI